MTSHPEWNQETGGLEVAKAFAEQIKGKNVLVTGVSLDSIGSSTSFAIASQAPNLLILASRTSSKLEEVKRKIQNDYPKVNVQTVLLDLMSQESIKQAATAVIGITDRLDVIINNAGIMTQQLQYTKEGIESQFGSNHIGHFLFTNLLLPLLLTAAKGNSPGATRVVNLTSLGHRLSPIRFHDYNFEGKDIPDEEKYPGGKLPEIFQVPEDQKYNGYIGYGQSKTGNVLFSLSLSEQLKDQGIVSYAVHPGSIWTGLPRELDSEGEATIRKTSAFWKNHDQGASTTMVAAFDPALKERKGLILHDCQFVEPAPHASSSEIAGKLWSLSEKLVGQTFKL